MVLELTSTVFLPLRVTFYDTRSRSRHYLIYLNYLYLQNLRFITLIALRIARCQILCRLRSDSVIVDANKQRNARILLQYM